MNDKIRLLLKYIGDRFPDGCGEDCDSHCPLYRALDKDELEYDLCNLLSNQEHRNR